MAKLYVKLLSDSQLFGSISNYRATFTATFSRSVTCASPRVHRVCTSILAWISGLLLHARGTQACLPSLVQGQVRAPRGHSPELPQRRQAARGSWAQLRSIAASPRCCAKRALSWPRPTTQCSRLTPCARRLVCAPCRAGGGGRRPALWSGLCGCLGWRVRGLGSCHRALGSLMAALDGWWF